MTRYLPPIYVLRHGETEWNRAGRLQGHLDSPLTPLGQSQAEAQAALLRNVVPRPVEAWVSDSGRSVETAKIALQGLDIPVRFDPRLREVGLGEWQGLTADEIEARWGWLVNDRDPFEWKFDAPGGESLEAFAARASEVLSELNGPTVLITHGLTSRVLRCLALGRAPSDLGSLPGGQGVVHVIENGAARILRNATCDVRPLPSANGTV